MLQKFSDMLLVFLTCIFYSTSSEDLHNNKSTKDRRFFYLLTIKVQTYLKKIFKKDLHNNKSTKGSSFSSSADLCVQFSLSQTREHANVELICVQ